MLECVTKDLGLPRANIWLWYKNGEPLDLVSSQVTRNKPDDNVVNGMPSAGVVSDNLLTHNDKPITSGRQLSARQLQQPSSLKSASPLSTADASSWQSGYNSRQSAIPARPSTDTTNEIPSSIERIRLINSGKYLFIPSLQLAHRANYSCVAVNRLGSGDLRDSYSHQVNVALAPSFVQPLPDRILWPEVTPLIDEYGNEAGDHNKLSSGSPPAHLELVCHVQCEPICQIEWFRNNEPLDVKRQADSFSSNFVTYQVKKTIMDENLHANLFKSVESRLIIQFAQPESGSNSVHADVAGQPVAAVNGAIFSNGQRDKILERRKILNEANYTCQSTSNTMGPPVRSTTKFIVQCEYFIELLLTFSF